MKNRRNSQKDYLQLQTVRKIAVIPATGVRFINGISNSYYQFFPAQLNQVNPQINKDKYQLFMRGINRKLKQYWPCCFAYYCGFLCIPFTLGLSLCLPKICIGQAEEVLKRQLKRMNEELFFEAQLEIRIERQCCQSRLIIQEIDFNQFTMGQMV